MQLQQFSKLWIDFFCPHSLRSYPRTPKNHRSGKWVPPILVSSWLWEKGYMLSSLVLDRSQITAAGFPAPSQIQQYLGTRRWFTRRMVFWCVLGWVSTVQGGWVVWNDPWFACCFLFCGVFLVQHGHVFTPGCIKVFTLLVGKWLQLTKIIQIYTVTYCNQFWGMCHGSITTSAMVNIIPLKCFWQVLDVLLRR